MNKYLISVLLLSLFSLRALFHSGLPPTHDGEYHVIRFYEFFKTLSSGVLYPRWALDLNQGMGAPLFNYVYPLPNYFSSLLHFLGVSFVDSFKANFIAAGVLGSVFMYFFSRIYFREIGAVVSSIFYTFAPYKFLDVYIRGSVGEVWALGFFPALFWALTRLMEKGNTAYLSLSAVFLAMIIFSHNILAVMIFIFSAFYSLFYLISFRKEKIYFVKVLSSYLLGLSLSAVFWIPAILEKKYVRGLDIFDFRSNFPEVYQLLIPSWGSGFSSGSLSGQMSLQVGVANLLVVFLSFLVLIKLRKKIKREILFFAVSFLVVLFLMTKKSLFLWESVPLLSYFQFPWRLLSLEIFITAFLAGFLWRVMAKSKIKGRVKTFIFVLFLVLPVLLTLGYSRPAYYHERQDHYYTTKANFISGTNSPGNSFNTIWAGKINKQSEKFEILSGEGKINYKEKKGNLYELYSQSPNGLKIRAAIMYFPGWKLYLDGTEVKIIPDSNGQILFETPSGKNSLTLRLENTPIQFFSLILSLVSGALVITLFLRLDYTIIKRRLL